MDPNYAHAWAFLGWTHIMDAGFGAQSATSQDFKQAVTLAEKTLAMDDSIAERAFIIELYPIVSKRL